MTHREVISRALAERLRQYEGSSIEERDQQRTKFLADTTEMIMVMIIAGTPERYAPQDDQPVLFP